MYFFLSVRCISVFLLAYPWVMKSVGCRIPLKVFWFNLLISLNAW